MLPPLDCPYCPAKFAITLGGTTSDARRSRLYHCWIAHRGADDVEGDQAWFDAGLARRVAEDAAALDRARDLVS